MSSRIDDEAARENRLHAERRRRLLEEQKSPPPLVNKEVVLVNKRGGGRINLSLSHPITLSFARSYLVSKSGANNKCPNTFHPFMFRVYKVLYLGF